MGKIRCPIFFERPVYSISLYYNEFIKDHLFLDIIIDEKDQLTRLSQILLKQPLQLIETEASVKSRVLVFKASVFIVIWYVGIKVLNLIRL